MSVYSFVARTSRLAMRQADGAKRLPQCVLHALIPWIG